MMWISLDMTLKNIFFPTADLKFKLSPLTVLKNTPIVSNKLKAMTDKGLIVFFGTL